MPMSKKRIHSTYLKPVDVIPALSGLIGKIALVSSFAVMWAAQYSITNPDFVFENVRLELIIGSVITLLAAIFLPNTAPTGTLAPLVVLIPSMSAFGVHPFVLSLLVGIIGIAGIKTKLFHKLVALSGLVSKASLTLAIGISGILLSIKKLSAFFIEDRAPFYILTIVLLLVYIILRRYQKVWLIIPLSAVISFLVPGLFGISIGELNHFTMPRFDPSYWWNEMWGIGFGLDFITLLKTLPFAFFVLLLWAADTVSINAMMEASYSQGETKTELNLDNSIIAASFRNMVGGVFGGAQTGALWRSFLIPLFMVKRPMGPASILLGVLGIIAGFTYVPVKLLSFPPLIWSVLLFGIFLPFTQVGIQGIKDAGNHLRRVSILVFACFGIINSPILTWVGAFIFEKIEMRFKRK